MTAMVLYCALGWAVFLALHLALNGRWWPWLAVSLLPPVALALVPLALLAAAVVTGGRLAAALAGGCLLVAWPQNGINLRGLLPRGPEEEGLRLVSWNTQHWNQGGDPDRFYAFLRALGADVYVLQEYLNGFEGGEVWDIDDEERLRAAFPGHHLAVDNNSVTLSRFPPAGPPVPVGACSLRVDLRVGDGVLSTYNVHIPVQLTVMNPLRPAFLRDMRRRAAARDREYAALVADLRGNPHPVLVTGDFNTSAAIGDIRRMPRSLRDAIGACRAVLPASWNARARLRLWRIDWAFTGGGARVGSYRFRAAEGLSDHLVQELTVTV
ncbi:endonuclease/exonuclease/phosphatase family protein [Streptomyces tanashiensis]|uniref:Endonuclease/exonuclease/phosphatase family protein n=1 Tax=Streptomyces tanashiensis TaxID=67367 RepID=A0ABY6QX45_9ACTN|nr:endonuclease/exonuclease/phosphatase family protein [Streptomyces tanashiensis]UZX21769.1 endonuclease/exonuclease/phosphatase family protein [Streptomyces tanashiensis]